MIEVEKPRVLVIQNGARHNYALPAAFAEAGLLEALYTDICAGRGIGRIAPFIAQMPLPPSIRDAANKISKRVPPKSVLSRTSTTDIETLFYELELKKSKDDSERQNALLAHAFCQGRSFSRRGLGKTTHLFNILGEGGKINYDAKSCGIPIYSDIIIALSTRRIVHEEYLAFPDWGPPPPPPTSNQSNKFDGAEHLLTTTDHFVCPSAFVAQDLIENWSVPAEQIAVVPYALNDAWFSMEPSPKQGRILFVGSADRRKGIHYLAEAARQLRDSGKNYNFRIAGGVATEVSQHPKAKALHFLGRIPRDQIKTEYAEADIFVLPSLAEGSATVIYEAMAAGLPVVTTPTAGSVITNGVDGLIVPPRNVDALAAAIERVVEDRRLRNRLSQEAKKRIKKYTWSEYSQKLRGLVGIHE